MNDMAGLGSLRRVSITALAGAAMVLAGCGNTTVAVSPTAPVTPPVAPPVSPTGAAGSVYVVQQPASGTGAILQFSATANGSVSPTSMLTMPFGFTAAAVATDELDELYVGGSGSGGPSVLVFAAGASGTATPIRTILPGPGTFTTPVALTFAGGLLYVLSGGQQQSIAVYTSVATGVAPTARVISGALTQIGTAQYLAADGLGNIFVANVNGTAGSVLVFNAIANGNVAPSSAIVSAAGVALNGLQGVTTDGFGDLFVGNAPPNGAPVAIYEFAAATTVNASLIKTISGSATGLTNPAGLALDGVGNLFVVGSASTTAPYGLTVSKFLTTATGNAAPITTLTSLSWTVPGGGQIAAF